VSVTASRVSKGRAGTTVRTVREILVGQGLRESLSAADEGFFFVEGADETAVYYNAIGHKRDAGLLKCCDALAQRGFTLTLFLSARESGLFVREE
jgi:hypothetical protein